MLNKFILLNYTLGCIIYVGFAYLWRWLMSTGTLPHCLYGRVLRNMNENDCAKSLRVVLLYGEFDNVPEFSRLYTFSML